jgi:OOP family OmpA-OmpF porin
MKKYFDIKLLSLCVLLFTVSVNAQENNYITSKYDFIPGEKVIFFDDFISESIGDFPAQWLTNGSGEIVTSAKFPGRWFNITKMGYYIPEAKEDFTENFTIEFDFVPITTDNGENLYSFTLYLLTGSLTEPGGGGEPGDAGFQLYSDGENLGWKNWSMASEQRFNGNVTFPFKTNQKYHVAVWVQKQRVRIYANENKVLDVPRGIPTGSKPNIVRFETRDEAVPLIANFRIAAGMSDMRNMLLKNGKIISYGLLFDVNSDKLKPESYATLKVISDILKEDPSLKLQIVGHTDSDGDDASNLDLSKRRAASVKNELVSKFGADAARLETDGKGESEPVTDNNSSVNKAKNRRVEFINLKDKAPASTVKANSKVITSAKSPITVEKGSFIDPRNGKNYKTTRIGTQIWLAENLAFKVSDGCWAYENKEDNVQIYGYLYNWTAAKSACPSGWHLPSDPEWDLLFNNLGGDTISGNKLMEVGKNHWLKPSTGATDEVGFRGIPAGARSVEGQFVYQGYYCLFWSSTQKDEKSVGLVSMYISNDINKVELSTGYPSNGVSVRCIKD